MIFRPELADLIINGRKTQTRRKVKPGETGCRYREGKDYAVQPGRGKTAIDRLYVTSVHQATVGEIDHQDALREGFENVGGFIDYWEALHGPIDFDQPVWVITFELYRGQDVRPAVGRDTVRRLRVAWDPGSAGPGLERRRAPEPEMVDPASLGFAWGRGARERHERERGRTRPPGDRRAAA